MINIEEYYEELIALAETGGWDWYELGEGVPMRRIWLHLPPSKKEEREGGDENTSLYLSAGVHGDEPAGVLACLEMMREKDFFQGKEVFMFPILNPDGLRVSVRTNRHGKDLNRDYFLQETKEIREHVAVLKTLPRFDAAFCLHEDWEGKGAYLYCLNAEQASVDFTRKESRKILKEMGKHVGIDQSTLIDESESDHGLIEKHVSQIDREDWPEAFYLCKFHTQVSYTLETPSTLDLEKRIAAHVAAIRSFC